MATPLIDVAATMMCPHGGHITFPTANARVRAGGAFVILLSDTGVVAGCPFNVSSAPQPCLTARFLTPASRVRVNGQPAVLQTASGICQGAAPQGSPLVIQTQIRAGGM
jgi:hypothetical protein